MNKKLFMIVGITCVIQANASWWNPKSWYEKARDVVVAPVLHAVVDTAKKTGEGIKKGAEAVNKEVIKPAGEGIKTAAEKTGEGIKTGAEAVAKAVTRDTKATRAIDYAARKAAFESAKGIATGALKVAEGGAVAVRETAKLTLQTAQGALSVAQAGTTTMLEGAKRGGALALEGTQWVLTKQLASFDITEITCTAGLQELASGRLPKTTVKLTVIGIPVSASADLDLKHPEETAKQLAQMVANAIIKVALPALS